MNLITIQFAHPEATQPLYLFGDQVAIVDKSVPPEDWCTGRIVGLRICDVYETLWEYAIKLDGLVAVTEHYTDYDLVPATERETAASILKGRDRTIYSSQLWRRQPAQP